MMQRVVILFFISVTAEIVSAATDKIVCYHGSWSIYRLGNGKFSPGDIDPTICTHLIYSFVGVSDDGTIQHLDEYLDIDLGNLKNFNALKEKNPNLKTLVAVGGWNEGSEKYSQVASDSGIRAKFVKNVVNFLKKYDFDGLDLDWEYPAQRGGAATDKENYVLLIQELRQEFDKHDFLLTAAVAASATSVDISYDVPSLSKNLDFINVMAYDFHGSWDGVTGQNAPLYASSVDTSDYQKLLNVEAAINGWIQRGANPQKIVLGLGVYGRTYTLSDANNNQIGALVSGAGTAGKYTTESGMLGYNEIVELQNEGGWTVVWDDEQKTPYMYKKDQWVGYDNAKSIKIKVEFAQSLNLGGIMTWSIDTDDFKGVSGTTFPILRAVNEAIASTTNENVDAAGVESRPSGSSSSSTSTSSSKATSVCNKVGYVRDPDDCSIFYYCMSYNGGYIALTPLSCNPGLVFDEENVLCNYPEEVDDC